MFAKLTTYLLLLPLVLAGTLVPRRNTPNFYLVATSSDPNYHLQEVKADQFHASIGSTGSRQKFYLEGGSLRIDNGGDPSGLLFGLINSFQGPNGCNNGGDFLLLPGFGSNKCARTSTFTLSSYNLNSQLGARLVFTSNVVTTFYVCANGALQASDVAVVGCTPVDLWTVPAEV